jgi:hypothetical protein
MTWLFIVRHKKMMKEKSGVKALIDVRQIFSKRIIGTDPAAFSG